MEELAIAVREEPGTDEVDRLAQLGIRFVDAARRVALGLPSFDLVGRQAEQEEILVADRVADLDVGTVQRPDGQRPVHGEFHVAGARRLLACRGDLFRQIGGGIHALAVLDVEVRQEHHLENLRDDRVAD